MTRGFQTQASGSGHYRNLALVGLAGVLIAIVALGTDNAFLLSLAGYTCGFALFALSVNMILGGVGEVPLGQCVFFGVGAYVPAIAMSRWGLPFEVGVAMGMAAAAVLAFAIGWLTRGLTGAYFSIVTWGLTGVAMVVALNLDITGGPLGLFGFSRLAVGPFNLTDPRVYFLVASITLLVVLIFLAHVRTSRFGHALESIRQSPHLAQSLGISVPLEKLKILVLSAPVAALGGALVLPYTQIVTPEVLSVMRTVEAMLAVLIGGTALLYGPVLGAVIFTVLPQMMDFDANVKMLVFSLLVIFVMIVVPGGLHQAIGMLRPARKSRVEA
ncbi:branched-chain amino acid ABC transporter permease [Castellaniella sp.]|uniref:branched-chain amino acid ABC transporter permease n=1 Tax=Castellaniella sp. TaxID=1955812 RepID=UPI00355EB657